MLVRLVGPKQVDNLLQFLHLDIPIILLKTLIELLHTST